MSTFLLTWNPAKWPWDDLADDINRIRRTGKAEWQWSSGNNTSIAPDDRVFMLKQGKGARGIFASGVAVSGVFQAPHYDKARAAAGDESNYVKSRWDTILDPEADELLGIDELEDAMPSTYWIPPASGFAVKPADERRLEQLWKEHLRRVRG